MACAAETDGGFCFGASGNKRVLCSFISDKSPTLGLGNVASLCAHVLRFWWAHPMQVVFQYTFCNDLAPYVLMVLLRNLLAQETEFWRRPRPSKEMST